MAENISIDIKDNHYVLSGDIKPVLANRRVLLSLKRLHFMENESSVEIPFEPKTKIVTLQGYSKSYWKGLGSQ